MLEKKNIYMNENHLKNYFHFMEYYLKVYYSMVIRVAAYLHCLKESYFD